MNKYENILEKQRKYLSDIGTINVDKRINNLKNLNLTTILVTERIEQIKSADLIIVLDNGEIVGMGQHTDLLNNSKIYKEIYDSQTESEVI